MTSNRKTQPEYFSSNAVHLSVREWLITLVIAAAILTALPEIWQKIETFNPGMDYRIPYDFSEDYWLFNRLILSVYAHDKILVIGDSVIWGQYVRKDQTLTHYLNECASAERFVNLGLDGSHLMALAGLIEHYCRNIEGKYVILHLNLLWLSSPEADLQIDKEFHFNHPRLVPQFVPRIPCYTEPITGKIGIILERNILLFSWARHLQSAYFDNTDLQNWTMENPYANPLSRITFTLPESGDKKYPSAESWNTSGKNQQDLPWVSLETSLQWRAFQRLVELLQARNNRVFIVVGPFNEHMLKPDSLKTYRQLLISIEAWLKEKNLHHYISPPLPSHLYADLSHPLSQGYALLAEQIWQHMEKMDK